MGTLVSCLCVTEDRPAFLPWLLWNYDRQAWRERELVIVASAQDRLDLPDRADIRVIRVPHRLSVGSKRNTALDEARGDIVAWFDDDDWQHPHRLLEIVAALEGGAAYVGQSEGWFVDVRARRCARYRGASILVFNGAGFRIDVARRARFSQDRRRGSDTIWLREIRSAIRDAGRRVGGTEWSAWLCHESNLSNPATRRRFPLPLEEMRRRMGSAWDGTDEALAALSARLGYGPADIVASAAPSVPRSHHAAAAKRSHVSKPSRNLGGLRLDQPRERRARADELGVPDMPCGGSADMPMTERLTSRIRCRAPDPVVAPIAVVIPVRDRAGARVRNALASLHWQTAGRASQITIVSHGSSHATDAELEGTCRDFGVQLVIAGSPNDPWSRTLALSTGIRATDPALSFLMMLDVDMILAPDFVAHVLGELRRRPETLVLCQRTELPRGAPIPAAPDRLCASLDALRRRGGVRRTGYAGGMEAAPRRFFAHAYGGDESRLRSARAESNDLVRRARATGLQVAWISDRTCMLHQWHPRWRELQRRHAGRIPADPDDQRVVLG